jgi:hypothetical protein
MKCAIGFGLFFALPRREWTPQSIHVCFGHLPRSPSRATVGADCCPFAAAARRAGQLDLPRGRSQAVGLRERSVGATGIEHVTLCRVNPGRPPHATSQHSTLHQIPADQRRCQARHCGAPRGCVWCCFWQISGTPTAGLLPRRSFGPVRPGRPRAPSPPRQVTGSAGQARQGRCWPRRERPPALNARSARSRLEGHRHAS